MGLCVKTEWLSRQHPKQGVENRIPRDTQPGESPAVQGSDGGGVSVVRAGSVREPPAPSRDSGQDATDPL